MIWSDRRRRKRAVRHAVLAVEAAFTAAPDVPDDATEDEFEVACDVEDLLAVLAGGLTRSGIGTGAYNDVLALVGALLARQGRGVDVDQAARLTTLRDAVVELDG
ncbi:hypothetical protein ACFUMH_00030 [Cellulomonas sp. NPDC057328]|uniref:hypothetical protein n=1 Tax=Cellulomonas sp. NPDC057328 TaxID=3346101 RepID=UPI00363AC669